MTDVVAAILLGGWGGYPPGDHVHHGFGEGLIDLVTGDLDMVTCWQQHERYLRAVAQRWGWQPAYWIMPLNEFGLRLLTGGRGEENEGPYFFAEALAIAGPQRV